MLEDLCLFVKALMRLYAINLWILTVRGTFSATGREACQSFNSWQIRSALLFLFFFCLSPLGSPPIQTICLFLQTHLAFCIRPHTSSLLAWWSGDDRLKFDGEDKGEVITGSLLCGFIGVVHHVLCNFYLFIFLNVWDGTLIPSAVTNFMGKQSLRPGCVGWEQKGRSVCWRLF